MLRLNFLSTAFTQFAANKWSDARCVLPGIQGLFRSAAETWIVGGPDGRYGVLAGLACVVRGVRVADVQVRLVQWACLRVRLVTSR